MSGVPSRDWLRLGGSAGEGVPSKAALEASSESPSPKRALLSDRLGRIGDAAQRVGSRASAWLRARRWSAPAIGHGLAALRAPFSGFGAGRSRRPLRIAGIGLACLVLPIVLYVAYAVATIPSDGGMAGEASPSAVFVTSADG